MVLLVSLIVLLWGFPCYVVISCTYFVKRPCLWESNIGWKVNHALKNALEFERVNFWRLLKYATQ